MSTEDGKPAKGDKQTALVAQLAEPRPFKAGVVGSNPTGCTKLTNKNNTVRVPTRVWNWTVTPVK